MDLPPEQVHRRFNYGIEYLCFAPGRGIEAVEILVKKNIQASRIDADFVGIIDQFFVLNALRNSPYKFFDSIARVVDASKEDEWRKFTVLRALDECEMVDISNALKHESVCRFDSDIPMNLLISKAECALRDNGIAIAESGWYKVRVLA